jgi:hypothetical protein
VRWALLSIIALPAMSVAAWFGFHHFKELREIQSRVIAGTTGSAYVMEKGIKAACAANGDFPCELTIIPTNLPAPVMFAGLMVAEPGCYMLFQEGEEIAKRQRTFVDMWHNEFHYRVEKSQRKSENEARPVVLRVFIWSNGPNQKDNNGKRDDIVKTFEVEVSEQAIYAPAESPPE